jgi:hypothetical protein
MEIHRLHLIPPTIHQAGRAGQGSVADTARLFSAQRPHRMSNKAGCPLPVPYKADTGRTDTQDRTFGHPLRALSVPVPIGSDCAVKVVLKPQAGNLTDTEEFVVPEIVLGDVLNQLRNLLLLNQPLLF